MPRKPDDDRSIAAESPSANKSPSARIRVYDDEGESDADRATERMATRAGSAYAGDHKNHGEEEIDDDDVIEELDLDEMPSFEGPDA
jgi:hypothetical protein